MRFAAFVLVVATTIWARDAPADVARLSATADLPQADQFLVLEEAGAAAAAIARLVQPEAPSPPPLRTRQAGDKDLTGVFRNAALWSAGKGGAVVRDGRLEIPVCWVAPESRHRVGRVITRDAVRQTWERAAAITFTGWGVCDAARVEGVRIQVGEFGPASLVGTAAVGQPVTMVLNFDFMTWSPACRPGSGLRDWEVCVYSLAVHEFGHAIGLEHEHDRLFFAAEFHRLEPAALKEALAACMTNFITAPTTREEDASGTTATAYDARSPMNYCFDIYAAKAVLTPVDEATVTAMYGRPSPR